MKKCVLAFLIFLQIVTLKALTPAPMELLPGISLLNNGSRWEQRAFERLFAAHRIFFSGSASMRSAFLRGRKIFGVPAVELRASYNAEGKLLQTDIIFANKGDSARQKNMNRRIQQAAGELTRHLTALFGPPKRKNYGYDRMQNRCHAWQNGIIEILLAYARNEYTILHIIVGIPTPDKAQDGEENIDLREKNFSGNLKKNPFGDVFIPNVPMVNQGSKGYCVPATVERVLRYYGITRINMHLLADAAKTGKGGGTSLENVFSALSSFRRAAGLKKVSAGDVRISAVKKYIDQGIPIFWSMRVNPDYEAIRRKSRTVRTAAGSAKEWKKQIRRMKAPSSGAPHLCLIIGYNEETEEIAVTNSWGNHEIPPSWVPVKIAKKVSQGRCAVLSPR